MTIKETASRMLQIRFFEEEIEAYFSKGLLRGTTHGSIGQETIAVALSEAISRDEDYVFATHRCHGHFIAYSNNTGLLVREMMGKETGILNGAGGSQHIRYKNFYTNGITGGMVPIATGVAMGLKMDDKRGVAIAILGDGGFNEGYVQEAFNLSKIYATPIVYIMEDNQFAMSTRTHNFTAGTIEKRIKSYDIEYVLIDQMDYNTMLLKLQRAVDFAREKKEPIFCHIPTFRLCGHSKSDQRKYMTEEEKTFYKEKDPLNKYLRQLTEKERTILEKQTKQAIEKEFEEALMDKECSIDELKNRKELCQ